MKTLPQRSRQPSQPFFHELISRVVDLAGEMD